MQRWRHVRLVASACLLVGAAHAQSPADPSDPMASWLRQKGLVATSVQPSPAVQMVVAALNFLDIHYRFGGNTPQEGFDCSGFTRHLFEISRGIKLPRSTQAQAQEPSLSRIQRSELAPGDLVFFNTLRRTFSHVGIYIGEGKFIHAPRTGAQVRVESLQAAYWSKRFTGARRPTVDLIFSTKS